MINLGIEIIQIKMSFMHVLATRNTDFGSTKRVSFRRFSSKSKQQLKVGLS